MSSFFKFAAIVVGATAVGATVATVVARRRCSATPATVPAAAPITSTAAPAAEAQKTQTGKYNPIFLSIWERARGIGFSSKWNNGTGYLDHAVTDVELKNYPTGVWKFTTDNQRKGIIIKDDTGLYVVFQRYTDCNQQLVMNCSLRNSSDVTVKELLEKAEGLMPQVS